jgi:hypothetical protein
MGDFGVVKSSGGVRCLDADGREVHFPDDLWYSDLMRNAKVDGQLVLTSKDAPVLATCILNNVDEYASLTSSTNYLTVHSLWLRYLFSTNRIDCARQVWVF